MIVMAPGQDIDAGYIPGKVYDKPAAGYIFSEYPRQIRRRDLLLVIFNAFLRPFAQFFSFIGEIYDRYVFAWDIDMFEKDRKGTLADRAITYYQNLIFKF